MASNGIKTKNLSKNVTVALVGKYVELSDAYLSVVEALKHGGIANDAEVNVNGLTLNRLKRVMWKNLKKQMQYWYLEDLGQGYRGKYFCKICQENHKPFLGICLGHKWLSLNLLEM